ncbi:odorant receptor 85b-like [Phlebotomus argentipes]|uniref:odorant receptor 85b-like n=1 Tax=Phlebotomus argentipes TaxID=94469 RepID=UPI0028934238|nr:odorant receptor 85b-like [Phlebotomus argentipes]
MLVVHCENLKIIFSQLRKFYTEDDNLLVKDVRRRHNSAHIHGITYGVIAYWIMLWFSEILLQVFIRQVGGLPYPMQYYIPFLSPDNLYFHLTNTVFQCFIFCATLTAIGTSDCMIIMFAFQLRSELVSLEEVISKLEHIEMYKEHQDILKTAYRMHLKLLNMFHELSDILFYMSFSQILSTFIGTTFLFYVVVMYGLDIAHFIIIVVVICQIFTFCLFGEIIFAKMSAFPNAFYLTKWYEFTPEDKWNLLHILHNAQKPCGLKAVGIVDVSIYTFVELVKLSGSYCAIIHALSNKGTSSGQ